MMQRPSQQEIDAALEYFDHIGSGGVESTLVTLVEETSAKNDALQELFDRSLDTVRAVEEAQATLLQEADELHSRCNHLVLELGPSSSTDPKYRADDAMLALMKCGTTLTELRSPLIDAHGQVLPLVLQAQGSAGLSRLAGELALEDLERLLPPSTLQRIRKRLLGLGLAVGGVFYQAASIGGVVKELLDLIRRPSPNQDAADRMKALAKFLEHEPKMTAWMSAAGQDLRALAAAAEARSGLTQCLEAKLNSTRETVERCQELLMLANMDDSGPTDPPFTVDGTEG